jgi:MFS family permease
MMVFGIAFLVVVCGLSVNLVNPPAGFVPEDNNPTGSSNVAKIVAKPAKQDCTPSEMMKSPAFYLLWILYFIGAGAGLMVISSIAVMAKKSLGEAAFVAVGILAVGNAGGRIIAGMLSDRIGRKNTLFIMLAFQAVLMFVAIPVVGAESPSALALVLVATLIGFNYGTNLSLFPSFAKDLWGLKNFGINYGILFTAWGVGGFVLSKLSQKLIVASSGSYSSSFITAGILLVIGAILAFTFKTSQPQSTVK